VDINTAAIMAGTDFLLREGIKNVRLMAARLSDISKANDGQYDVVFSDAVLIYVGPREIEQTVKDMLRIAGNAVILLERFYEGDMRGTYRYGCWERDYPKLFAKFCPNAQIIQTKITRAVWDEERWAGSGLLIEVKKA